MLLNEYFAVKTDKTLMLFIKGYCETVIVFCCSVTRKKVQKQICVQTVLLLICCYYFLLFVFVLYLCSIHAKVLCRQQLAWAVGARNQPDIFPPGKLRSTPTKGHRQPSFVPVSSETKETLFRLASNVAGQYGEGLLQDWTLLSHRV